MMTRQRKQPFENGSVERKKTSKIVKKIEEFEEKIEKIRKRSKK
jgi:hypothetical protein